MDNLLLNVADLVPESIKGETCRHCQHRERWECGGSVIQYCGFRKSNRTDNGLLKIKAKNPACLLFKPEPE